MNKKSVSATILILFLALVFSVIGICFSSFVYNETRVLVETVGLKTTENISVFHDEKLTQKATALKLSNMDIGLKPATGEVDAETQVPSTITDQGTSEGYYATVFVRADVDFKVVVNNIKIETSHDENIIKEERKNIFVSIKDVKNSTKSLEKDEIEISKYIDSEKIEKITFYIWLGAFSTDELEGSKISFVVEFVEI